MEALKKRLCQIIVEQDHIALRDCASGDIVPLAATHFPVGSFVQAYIAEQRVISVALLTAAGSAAAKIYEIASAHQLDPYFSPEMMAEVAAILANPHIDDAALVDYSDKPFCTIDGPHTRDLDQALFIDKNGTGLTVYYAIADAAYYVKPDSALFNEALKRGASYYLPGLMIPMLPRELCEGVISLNADVPRRAVVFEMALDATGRHLHTHITRARIKSRAKLTFDEVQAFFDHPNQGALSNTELSKSLLRLKKVGLLRLHLAEERKVARYHRTEINIEIGVDGLVFNLLDNIRNTVELYNEQLSLLCNMAGARALGAGEDEDYHTQAIYKIHDRPPAEKIQHFEDILNYLIVLHRLEPTDWLWDQLSSEALADYLKKLPTSGKYARITQAINRQALMTNNRAQFSKYAGKHYGVGADVYARFSAPMREVVGVFLHKELLEKTGYVTALADTNRDETLRDQVILSANRAKDLQNELTKAANKLVMDQLFMADMQLPQASRPARMGTIIGLSKDKLYVLLDAPEIEVKVYIKALEALMNTSLTVDAEQISLYRSANNQRVASLGDAVSLTVIENNALQDQWVFQLDAHVLS